MATKKRVIIIGAGPCGLPALKEMLERGHDATLFERASDLGGLFSSSAIYPDLHLTISNWVMAYSDFPAKERQSYPSGKDYLQYLQDYAAHFGLGPHIRYNSEVVRASREDDGSWSIEISQQGKRLAVHADALIVATGSHQVPNPPPDGLVGFDGPMIHSNQYGERFKKEVKEKKLRVLVVGGGESGADISAELGDLSPNVTVWLRRYPCTGPRYLNMKDEMGQVQENKTKDFPVNGFLEAATTNRMSAAQNVYLYGIWRRVLWKLPILNPTMSKVALLSTDSDPVMNDQATYVTKNQRMCEALHHKKIELLVSSKIMTKGRTCRFEMSDGTIMSREYDAVVLATGFHAEFPFLEFKDGYILTPDPRSWYLHCFPKSVGHTLSFVGYARPHQGGIPPMAEIQSRYVALVLSEEKRLPSDYAAQAERHAKDESEYYHISPQLRVLVDYNSFLESVARKIGCEPSLPLFCTLLFNAHMLATALLLLNRIGISTLGSSFAGKLWVVTVAGFFLYDDALLIKWWFYPHWPVYYRDRGPGAVPGLLRSVLQRTKFWKSTAVTRGFILLVIYSIPTYYFQRLISFFLFLPHVLLNTLGIRFSRAMGGLWRPKLYALSGVDWRFSDLFTP
jgi:4-hydroxybenzoate brominase (decarboxylating)